MDAPRSGGSTHWDAGELWPIVSGHQRDPVDVHADLALLANAGMQIVPVSADQGLLAGRLRARHYQRQRCAVSLADCLAAAAALTARLSLATSDPALAALIRAENGTVHPLADSKGIEP
jgi:PIN domain